jgi:hypothetical protein
MLSECKNAPQPETEPTQKFPYKARISNKNTFELFYFIGATKYYSILLFLLPAGLLCVRAGNDKELQIGKTSSRTHHHMKCMHA